MEEVGNINKWSFFSESTKLAPIGMTLYPSQGREVGASATSEQKGGESLQDQPARLVGVITHISTTGWAC